VPLTAQHGRAVMLLYMPWAGRRVARRVRKLISIRRAVEEVVHAHLHRVYKHRCVREWVSIGP